MTCFVFGNRGKENRSVLDVFRGFEHHEAFLLAKTVLSHIAKYNTHLFKLGDAHWTHAQFTFRIATLASAALGFAYRINSSRAKQPKPWALRICCFRIQTNSSGTSSRSRSGSGSRRSVSSCTVHQVLTLSRFLEIILFIPLVHWESGPGATSMKVLSAVPTQTSLQVSALDKGGYTLWSATSFLGSNFSTFSSTCFPKVPPPGALVVAQDHLPPPGKGLHKQSLVVLRQSSKTSLPLSLYKLRTFHEFFFLTLVLHEFIDRRPQWESQNHQGWLAVWNRLDFIPKKVRASHRPNKHCWITWNIWAAWPAIQWSTQHTKTKTKTPPEFPQKTWTCEGETTSPKKAF